jgi:hypothetical protein
VGIGDAHRGSILAVSNILQLRRFSKRRQYTYSYSYGTSTVHVWTEYGVQVQVPCRLTKMLDYRYALTKEHRYLYCRFISTVPVLYSISTAASNYGNPTGTGTEHLPGVLQCTGTSTYTFSAVALLLIRLLPIMVENRNSKAIHFSLRFKFFGCMTTSTLYGTVYL